MLHWHLVGRGQRSGKHPTVHGQPPQGIIQLEMSVVPRLGNPGIDILGFHQKELADIRGVSNCTSQTDRETRMSCGCCSFITLLAHIKGFGILMVYMLAAGGEISVPSTPLIPQSTYYFFARKNSSSCHCLSLSLQDNHRCRRLSGPVWQWAFLPLRPSHVCICSQEVDMVEPDTGAGSLFLPSPTTTALPITW